MLWTQPSDKSHTLLTFIFDGAMQTRQYYNEKIMNILAKVLSYAINSYFLWRCLTQVGLIRYTEYFKV